MKTTLLLMTLLLGACVMNTTPAHDLPAPYEKDGVRIEILDLVRFSGDVRGVHGYATNTTVRDVANCKIRLRALDRYGAWLANMSAETGPLPPGTPTSFRATFDQRSIKEFKTLVVAGTDVEFYAPSGDGG